MYKIVLIDDEGRKVIKEKKPHVIFTGIEIPKKNAMEKLVGLKTEFSDSQITVANIAAVNSFIVKRAMAYIEEHYNEALTLMEVAEQVYVSKWHLSKLLNQYMGQGFSMTMNVIRIKHAKELLRDQSLRISDVSEMVGFVNYAHFSRVFKKIVGISAYEYRNKIQ